jgi:hypothetical protein
VGLADVVGVGVAVVVVGVLGTAALGVLTAAGDVVGPIAVSEPGQKRNAATTPPARSATTMRPIKARERRGFARRARAMVTTPELVKTSFHRT